MYSIFQEDPTLVKETGRNFNYKDFKENMESCIIGLVEGDTLQKTDMVRDI